MFVWVFLKTCIVFVADIKNLFAATTMTDKAAVAGEEEPPRKKGGVITNYFLLILFAFGCMQVYLNTLTMSDNQHQGDHIRAFQKQHFVKSHSASRKAHPKEEDSVVVAKEEGEKNTGDDEEETDYRDLEGAGKQHSLAGLSCDRFGGPADEIAREMVYWEDVPSDSLYVSPFQKKDQKQYLTFEADHGTLQHSTQKCSSGYFQAFLTLVDRRLEQHSNGNGDCDDLGCRHGKNVGLATWATNVSVDQGMMTNDHYFLRSLGSKACVLTCVT